MFLSRFRTRQQTWIAELLSGFKNNHRRLFDPLTASAGKRCGSPADLSCDLPQDQRRAALVNFHVTVRAAALPLALKLTSETLRSAEVDAIRAEGFPARNLLYCVSRPLSTSSVYNDDLSSQSMKVLEGCKAPSVSQPDLILGEHDRRALWC